MTTSAFGFETSAMAAVASQSAMAAVAPTSSRSSSMVNGNAANSYKNVGSGSLDSPASSVPQAPPTAPIAKKGKGKKAVDPNETSKLLAAKINQLENDAAGEKDQEIEIGRLREHLPKQMMIHTDAFQIDRT